MNTFSFLPYDLYKYSAAGSRCCYVGSVHGVDSKAYRYEECDQEYREVAEAHMLYGSYEVEYGHTSMMTGKTFRNIFSVYAPYFVLSRAV